MTIIYQRRQLLAYTLQKLFLTIKNGCVVFQSAWHGPSVAQVSPDEVETQLLEMLEHVCMEPADDINERVMHDDGKRRQAQKDCY